MYPVRQCLVYGAPLGNLREAGALGVVEASADHNVELDPLDPGVRSFIAVGTVISMPSVAVRLPLRLQFGVL